MVRNQTAQRVTFDEKITHASLYLMNNSANGITTAASRVDDHDQLNHMMMLWLQILRFLTATITHGGVGVQVN